MDINSFVIGYKKGKASGGGGGSVEKANTVTFMSEDGSTVLYQLPVLDGNTCADVVAQGIIATPTKPSTAQYDYTFSGWSFTSGGAADSNALFNITEDRTVYVAFAGAVRYYTITYYDGDTVLKTEQLVYGAIPSYTPIKEGYTFQYWVPEIEKVTGDAAYYAQFIDKPNLVDSTWAKISEISEDGLGESYFAVGDCKEVAFKGIVGEASFNKTFYVYIIGFNHNSEYEGNGIHFGTFKSAASNGIDLCLVDGRFGNSSTDGSKWFNMNHWSNDGYGGWAGCDMRYDIIGSTDKAPSDYGKAVPKNRVGYDPSPTCATNPVAGTFMAALPSDLRAVMKPMTKYTGYEGDNSGADGNPTATIDYLPFLAEYEIFGTITIAVECEQKKQAQYAYYANGNSKRKYKHNSISTGAYWWGRSVTEQQYNFFTVGVDGDASKSNAYWVSGIAPIFKV